MSNEVNPLKKLFIDNSWREESVDCLLNFSLYKNIESLFTYQNRLAVQFHADGNEQYLCLTISDWGIGVCRTMQGKLTRTVNENSVGFKFDLKTNPDAIVQYIIDNQDNTTIHNANEHYMFNTPIQAILLMLEQFLNKEKYLASTSNSSQWSAAEISAMDESEGLCQENKFDKAQEYLLSYLDNDGVMNIYLFYNLLFTCVNAGVKLSPNQATKVIESGLHFLNSSKQIDDCDRQYIFFITRLTYLMLQQEQYKEIVETIRKYTAIGGKIDGDVLLNYSHAASSVDDQNLVKEVLKEMIQIYNADFKFFKNKNQNNYIWYLADNIASLSVKVDDKETTVHYLRIARGWDPEFINNKTDETYKTLHNDPDFLALFNPLSSEETLLNKIRQRAINPKTIHDMVEGLSPTPEINNTILLATIENAEANYGFKFPSLFKEIYTQIGNGGFGPGYGLYSFSAAKSIYEKLIKSDWQAGVWPLCTWGCAIDSYVNCTDQTFPVYYTDGSSSSSEGCDNPVTFTFTDANGNVSTGKGGNIMSVLNQLEGKDEATANNNGNNEDGGLAFHKASFSEWMSDWTKGVSLWDEMSNESDDDFNEVTSAMDFTKGFAEMKANENTNPQGDDPEIFPGSPVSRLSDYVKIIKGMQSGNMNVLADYGLDMIQYASISQAWASKLADPQISLKFSEMLAK